MVTCNITVGIEPEDLQLFDTKRGDTGRSSIIRHLIKAWLNGDIEIKLMEIKMKETTESIPTPDTPMKE